jgi:hypothetical protein
MIICSSYLLLYCFFNPPTISVDFLGVGIILNSSVSHIRPNFLISWMHLFILFYSLSIMQFLKCTYSFTSLYHCVCWYHCLENQTYLPFPSSHLRLNLQVSRYTGNLFESLKLIYWFIITVFCRRLNFRKTY